MRRKTEAASGFELKGDDGPMQITAAMVKELRDRTGAGMMDCKRALTESQGDLDKAVEIMRLSGQAKADKKAGRIAAEGVVAVNVDGAGRRAAMVEINCETDFVAKEAEFRRFVDAVCARVLETEPADVGGRAATPLHGEGGPTIDEERRALVGKIGENISVRRFATIDSRGGRLGSYVHGTRIGVVVDLEGGDDTVARDIAMHVAASRPVAIASVASTASSAFSGIRRSDTNSVGGWSFVGWRPQMSKHSWMAVFSEKAIRRGSWVVTIRSMWKRSARNWRSAIPPTPVQAVTGNTFANTPRLEFINPSASGVKNVLMLLVVIALAAPA